MKRIKLVALCFLFLSGSVFSKPDLSHITHPLSFKKVVIWGHKLHSHTHSYIHYAFYKTFKHLGYNTYWFDNKDDVRDIDFSHSLFITEGQVDQKIPLRDDCRYILHNCKMGKYKKLFDQGNCIVLQVYTHDCLKRDDQEIEKCFCIDLEHKVIYMPWATDLLPYQVDEVKQQLSNEKKENYTCYVGTINRSGQINNRGSIYGFASACKNNGIDFKNYSKISPEKNVEVIRKSLFAPAIQGAWQCEHGYIPCRIFKNISYGSIGITNSKTVYELFNKKIIYNPDTYQLGLDAIEKMKNFDMSELYELMDFVRDNHTYINRINYLFWFLDMVKPIGLS